VSRRLDDDARRLLDGVNVGHLSTLMPGGEPKVEPVWVMVEGETVLVTTDARSIKARNVARDARVALSVTAAADPYDQLLIRGRVAEIRSDEDLSVLDAFARKYLGRDFPRRKWSERVVLVIEPSLVRSYRSPLSELRPSAVPEETGSEQTGSEQAGGV
jgi:PPOX class probable F420-dependent enzyme